MASLAPLGQFTSGWPPKGVGRLRPQARAASNRRRRLLASVGIRAENQKPVQHIRPPPKLPLRQHFGGGLHIPKIVTLPPAFLISHGTAYGGTMIASPPGEAMGAAAPEEQKMPFQNIGKGRAEARPWIFRYSPPAGPVRRRTSPGSGPGPCPRHPALRIGGWRRG